MSEERIGTEVNVDEYMKVADYVNKGLEGKAVKEAEHANTAQGCNDAFALGGKKAEYYAAKSDMTELESRMNVALAGKVDTDDDRGLSMEDYTTVEKAKLAELGVEPVGCIKLFAGNVLPEGYMWCDGEAYPTNGAYTKLFAAIGTIYNKDSDIPGTFRVPDMCGRVGVGKDAETFKILGADGGEKEHKLKINEIPSHNHAIAHEHPFVHVSASDAYKMSWKNNGGYITGNEKGSSIIDAVPTDDYVKTSAAVPTISGYIGGTEVHNNLQPYLVCNYIIKY